MGHASLSSQCHKHCFTFPTSLMRIYNRYFPFAECQSTLLLGVPRDVFKCKNSLADIAAEMPLRLHPLAPSACSPYYPGMAMYGRICCNSTKTSHLDRGLASCRSFPLPLVLGREREFRRQQPQLPPIPRLGNL